jgi:3D-(3,5/4)-trihydroxycyclohexane-1,2-dione acylhydrolase (decyclizing)
VFVLVGDGSYLMMSSEIATAVQEGYKLTIVLLDNQGFKSIGALSRSLGQGGFGTRYGYRLAGVLPDDDRGVLEPLPVDLAANARSLGARVIECQTRDDLAAALDTARSVDRTTVIHIQNDRLEGVPGYESWWDVPPAEVSESETVAAARRDWEAMRARERSFL